LKEEENTSYDNPEMKNKILPIEEEFNKLKYREEWL